MLVLLSLFLSRSVSAASFLSNCCTGPFYPAKPQHTREHELTFVKTEPAYLDLDADMLRMESLGSKQEFVSDAGKGEFVSDDEHSTAASEASHTDSSFANSTQAEEVSIASPDPTLATFFHAGTLQVDTLRTEAKLEGSLWSRSTELLLQRSEEEKFVGATLRDPLIRSMFFDEHPLDTTSLFIPEKFQQFLLEIYGHQDNILVRCSVQGPFVRETATATTALLSEDGTSLSGVSEEDGKSSHCYGTGFVGKMALRALASFGKKLDIRVNVPRSEILLRVTPALDADVISLRQVLQKFGVSGGRTHQLKIVVHYPTDFVKRDRELEKKTVKKTWFGTDATLEIPVENGVSRAVKIEATL